MVRAFWFHYNKPESRKQKRNVLTLHFAGACHMVHAIRCKVPVSTRNRKSQPHCVLAGKGAVAVKNEGGLVVAEIL